MTDMSDRYLNPAYGLIKSFSGGSGVMRGVDEIAEIVERNRVSVYRWMVPPEKGGTGGFIPADSMRKLSEYARKNRGPKAEALKDFFGGDRAVA